MTGKERPELCDGFGMLPGEGVRYCPGCPSCGVDPDFDRRIREVTA